MMSSQAKHAVLLENSLLICVVQHELQQLEGMHLQDCICKSVFCIFVRKCISELSTPRSCAARRLQRVRAAASWIQRRWLRSRQSSASSLSSCAWKHSACAALATPVAALARAR